MAVPLLMVATLASRVFKALNLGSKTNVFGGGSAIASILSYLAYEIAEPDPFPASTLPTSKPIDKTTVKANPSVKEPITAVTDVLKSHNETAKKNVTDFNTSLLETGTKITEQVQSLATRSEASPLLTNQVALVDALHSVAMSVEAQAIVLSSIYETLDSNLGGLVALASINAQNIKVQGDYQKQTASNSDYGDGDYFYAFVPTSQYWHEVDVALINGIIASGGSTEFIFVMPSAQYAGAEISLIDSMMGQSKSDIRKAVEAFRIAHVDSGTRAMLGVSLVQAKADSTENTKAQTDYYKTATEATKAKEVSASSASASYGANTDLVTANALASLASSLAPSLATIADASISAKVVTDHAQTVKDIHDLDGAIVARMAPMEATAVHEATRARTATDVNSDDYSDDLPSIPDLFPLLKFAGRGDVFDKNSSSPSNVFSHV